MQKEPLHEPDSVVEIARQELPDEIRRALGLDDGLVGIDIWNIDESLSVGCDALSAPPGRGREREAAGAHP